jgi:hypothetical protein
MQDQLAAFSRGVNFTRYRGQPEGHYESFFVRANHPHRGQAFWIRYTIFSPKGRPDDAIGEIWAIFFDAEQNRHAVAKQEYRLSDCDFDASSFGLRVGKATLLPNRLEGAIEGTQHSLAWNLKFEGDSPPALLLPLAFYERRFPAAKSVVSLPMARFSGVLTVDGKQIEIADWVGSQNHNWGSRHTDLYAWGQVAGFDNQPDSFWRWRLRGFAQAVLDAADHAHGASPQAKGIRVHGIGAGDPGQRKVRIFFVAVCVAKPGCRDRSHDIGAAGGVRGIALLQSAGWRETLPQQQDCPLYAASHGQARRYIGSAGDGNRAAFEILTDDETHGVEMSA